MKYYPGRAPARIDPCAEIRRLQRDSLLASIAQSVAAGIIGLIAGIVLAQGYLADLPAWLR